MGKTKKKVFLGLNNFHIMLSYQIDQQANKDGWRDLLLSMLSDCSSNLQILNTAVWTRSNEFAGGDLSLALLTADQVNKACSYTLSLQQMS